MIKTMIAIEKLHLIAGYSLIIAGILVFFISGFEMAISRTIFGAMYISMSDVGENEMCKNKLQCTCHSVRRSFGYLGAILGILLVGYYLAILLSII